LVRLLVHTHHRYLWVVWTGVNGKYIFHRSNKSAVLFRRYTPVGFQVRLKLCFFKRRFTVMCDNLSV
jgi:hypothetical protein